MKFYKYHGLGNDYIVIDPSEIDQELTESTIRAICHRNFGLGSDGILLGPIQTDSPHMYLRIFNPDGSEAEKSGNGLRIFSRYLWEKNKVMGDTFQILTKGGLVNANIHDNGRQITVDMGAITFLSDQIPVAGDVREVINEQLMVQGQPLTFCGAGIGNPHCVILTKTLSVSETKSIGPLIECHPIFPNKTNVQFMKVIDRNHIAIEIWERGAGYTLASGSSSCAAAAVAHRIGLCEKDIVVHMPGGDISINILDGYNMRMTGAVVKIAEGELSPQLFEHVDSSI